VASLTLLLAISAGCLGACGNVRSADLFLLTRSGTIPGAKLTMIVSDGGSVTCNHGPPKDISSHQLLIARQIVRDLEGLKGNGDGNDTVGPADRNLKLEPQPGSVLGYRVRAEAGTVGFSDNSRGQPKVFRDIAAFTRETAIGVCGLPR
jgi:hypothetical protein